MKRLLAFLALALAMLASAPAAQAGSYTLPPSQDTDVRENGGGTSNCGACTQISTRRHSTGEYRTLYQFDLSTIPAGERVVSATLRIWVTAAVNSPVSIYRVTQSWSESSLTWANSAGVSHDTTVMGSFSPASSGRYYDIDITSLATLWRGGTANYGLIMKLATTNTLATYTSKEWATATQRPQLVVVTQPAPSFTMVASTSLVSDPFNNAVNPKAIPAAKARYTVSVSNSSAGSSDSGTAFTFPVPTGMDMCVGDIGAAGSGPVSFANGAVSSGLSYSYVSLASTTDSLAFSNNGGTSFGYTPAADPGGCDSNVTHVKVSPGGAFAAKTGATAPSLTLQMLMRVR